MRKMNTAVNKNDRIVIDIKNRECIQYILIDAKTGKETPLGEPIAFSLSVKKYFGTKGRIIKELYAFKSWHNKKLETEMKRIWRAMDALYRVKDENARAHSVVNVTGICEDERAA